MSDSEAIVRRKDEHLDIALAQQARRDWENPFDAYAFDHCALPEIAFDQVDLRARFLTWSLRLPFIISSMTGGPSRGSAINAHLAEAAEHLGVILAVGSQRVALEGAGAAGIDEALRRRMPTAPLLGNLGAAQLVLGYGVDEARRAIEMIGADGLIIHLNPLQEAVQPGGDGDWRGVLSAIEMICARIDAPVLVKEVGAGLSASVARRLHDAGVAALDVAGRGGTSWAGIEADRTEDGPARTAAAPFRDWGISTPRALQEVREALPGIPLIGSGGVRHGLDAAKALRLGADLVGQAGSVLQAGMTSAEAVINHFEIMARQLRICCFATGSGDLTALRQARLVCHALPVHDV
ncbi:type 2 isopentenyl-diphosphate Delta-isomerase [Caulobacter segnis]|uniref:type 2 isopentenyl-diphosphate Delta-isomerase n=1 Tax=Caulobacter segnis TaxID=88688 RepID=UPI0024108C62|nr:type 2 isopentenyl-diphosphate Delta-isomerase [Caulobacter segnis]MDG2520614.1 type 2 isopentenyl-diphosphate Delta-isomerase [Caulobacter segnis]